MKYWNNTLKETHLVFLHRIIIITLSRFSVCKTFSRSFSIKLIQNYWSAINIPIWISVCRYDNSTVIILHQFPEKLLKNYCKPEIRFGLPLLKWNKPSAFLKVLLQVLVLTTLSLATAIFFNVVNCMRTDR